jgi:hypothetical protein
MEVLPDPGGPYSNIAPGFKVSGQIGSRKLVKALLLSNEICPIISEIWEGLLLTAKGGR